MTKLDRVVAVAVTMASLGASCSYGAGGGSAAVARDTVAGVEIVRNPSEPVGPAIRAVLLWEQAGGNGAEGAAAAWEQPRAIVSGPTEVYVLDRQASRVIVLEGVDGRVLRTFGRPGSGPGEFERAYGLAVIDDTVIVASGGTGSLELFHRDGTYGRRMQLGRVGFWLRPLTDRRLLVTGFVGAGSSPWTIWPLAEDATPESLTLADTSVTGEVLFSSCVSSTAVGGRIARVACRSPQLVLYDSAGHPMSEIRVAIQPELTPDSVLDMMAARFRARVGAELPSEQASALVDRMREDYRENPKYTMVRGDDVRGRYVVREQTPDVLGGGPATLHLFDASGVYESTIAFDRAWFDFDVRDGVVYALTRDPATDLVAARAYRLLPAESR